MVPAKRIPRRPPPVLITAGPTREKIDPVRYISNYSTGTFGYEIAKEALRRGSRVTLVSGPTCLVPPKGARLIKVESALEMRTAVKRELGKAGLLIMAAAVADWRPALAARKKIKRSGAVKVLEFVENPDILREIGRKKRAGLVLVGFALETGGLAGNALKKMLAKRLDMVVANTVGRRSGAFGDNIHNILIIDRHGNRVSVKGKTKKQLAKIILDKAFGFKL
jgi:phosphopantothenoylcysteine decarboxylase/phosphopantothenate--cysteine ligase